MKQIRFFGQPVLLVCDGECNKAWGINSRPRVDDEADEPLYLGDDELGFAPLNPGTWEGGEGKPNPENPELNKWCARECERSTMAKPDGPLMLWSFPGHGKQAVKVEVGIGYLKDKRGSWKPEG